MLTGKPYPPPLDGAVTRISVCRPPHAPAGERAQTHEGLQAPRATMSTGVGGEREGCRG
jgi:hypothetical protein